MTPEYERGYRDGMENLSAQIGFLNDQVSKVTAILHKAVFMNKASTPPRPGTHIWLIMDSDMISSGYYIGGKYLADSGHFVDPIFWCMIPRALSGENDGPRRRLVKRD